MSKFDVDRVTKEQLVAYAKGDIEEFADDDQDQSCAPRFQVLLDAARVPEPKTAAELEKEFANMMIRDGVFATRIDINTHLSAIEDARKREAGEE